jgi:hypothetical protein
MILNIVRHSQEYVSFIVKDSLSGGGKSNTLFLAQMYSEIIKNETFLYSFSFNWNGEGGVQKLKISNLFSFHLWLSPFIWTGSEE